MAESELDTLRPVLEALALCRSPELRERLLFEAVDGLGLARALALWSCVGPADDPRLCEVLARGPAELLPGAHEVRATLDGTLGFELPDRRVVLPGDGSRRLVFAFGGITGPEEAFDFVEAVLLVWSIVEASDVRDALDTLPSPVAQGALASEGNRLAHDLRNLLQSIAGNAELLELAEETGGHDAELERLVERDVSRAGALLRQAFGGPPTAEAASTAQQIEDVCAGERALCRRSGIELLVSIEPEARRGRAAWSELQLERVLRNLIQNARQAVASVRDDGSGGTIRVHWERPPQEDGEGSADGFRLRVRDDGPGLPDGFRPGFGLSSVQALSQQVGGRLSWQNLPTGGAELVVRVPVAGGPGPRRDDRPAMSPDSPEKGSESRDARNRGA